MRRNDKEIKDPELILKVLNQSEACRIALCDGGKPYMGPMNFAYHDNLLYLHSATEGRKIDIIRKNSNISFQMDIKTQIVPDENPCNWGMKYLSVTGSGQAHLIHDTMEKKEAMNIIMAKYSSENSFEYTEMALNNILVIKIEIEEMTGKKSGY